MSSKAPVLEITREAGLWTFTLNVPERRNALSAELVDALQAGLDDAHRENPRLLVLRGAGRNFSAGFDFTDVQQHSEGDLLLRFVRIEQLLQTLAASPCLTLGLAHGKNFGAGVDLLAACKLRIASPDVSFRMPGLKFGLVLGTRRFADIVGVETARRVLEETAVFDAGQALAMGFLHRVGEVETWPLDIAAAQARAQGLDDSTRGTLYRVLDPGRQPGRAEADLAELVRSAARPGLKERIARYLAA